MISDYARSLGFIECPWGCGGVVHPNPSNPDASQGWHNHICIERLKAYLATEELRERRSPTEGK